MRKYKRIATVSERAGGYTDKNVTAGKKYYYKVQKVYKVVNNRGCRGCQGL